MMIVSGFDWDGGNWPKCGKHGLSKDEIEGLFEGLPTVMADPNPAEPRMRAIGRTRSGRYLFLVFMFRTISGRTYIRPISARYMHRKEVEHYENR
jgi:uncharacterized DUF497 family protein